MKRYVKDGTSPGKTTGIIILLLMFVFLTSPLIIAGSIDDETCMSCHDEVGEAFPSTLHGIYFSKDTRLLEYGCESCHGDGAAHVESEDPALIYNPANDADYDVKESCLSCHRQGEFSDWEASHHAIGDLSCADCHTVHTVSDNSLKADTPELCYGCHSDVRSATYMPSHHPIAEGKLECQDCHAIHGTENAFAFESKGNELCWSCHADKEGPFVYEHAPVIEDCQICHTPHGSVADNLLKQNEPTLCLNCHSMHFHATIASWDGDFATPQEPDRAGTSNPRAWQGGMLTKCTSCHRTIHGSDMPSQSISGGGQSLTR